MEARLEEGLAHFHANHKFLSFYTFDSSSDVEAEESAVDALAQGPAKERGPCRRLGIKALLSNAKEMKCTPKRTHFSLISQVDCVR